MVQVMAKFILGKPGPYLRGVRFSLYCILQHSGANMIFEGVPAAPGAPGEMVPASAAQSLPSTRAGGQDDGSNKLPQIITK